MARAAAQGRRELPAPAEGAATSPAVVVLSRYRGAVPGVETWYEEGILRGRGSSASGRDESGGGIREMPRLPAVAVVWGSARERQGHDSDRRPHRRVPEGEPDELVDGEGVHVRGRHGEPRSPRVHEGRARLRRSGAGSPTSHAPDSRSRRRRRSDRSRILRLGPREGDDPEVCGVGVAGQDRRDGLQDVLRTL